MSTQEHNPITVLSSRVGSLEERMEKHSSKIETKLDQLVELMQKVTQLQEREARNADDIHDLREAIKGLIIAQDSMNHRWHERLDKIILDLEHHKDTSETKFNGEIDKLKTSIDKTDKTLHQWLNRAVGGWFAGALLIIIVQGLSVFIVKDSLNKVDINAQKIQLLEAKSSERSSSNTQRIIMLEAANANK